MPKPKPTLYLIDGAGYYFRAFYAIRQYLSNARGEPTNAVYGFALMLRKIMREKKPDHLLMVFDSREKTFRHEMYPMYKAHRPDMPEELASQLPKIDRLIEGYNIPSVRAPGYEADDLIGAIADRAAGEGFDVVIVTSDKDLMQLIRSGVSIYDSMKDKIIGPEEVAEKFGTAPEKVTDVLGLMGDTSDNIPGVPGVGEKTARALIQEYGGLDETLAAAADGRITRKKLRENLVEFAEQARLSKKLATVAREAPVEFSPEAWKTAEPDTARLRELFTELEFTTLLEDLGRAEGPKTPRDYTAVTDRAAFDAMIAELAASQGFAVDTETTSLNAMRAELVGISLSCAEGRAWYVPLRHDYDGAPEQLGVAEVVEGLRPLLENEAIPKYGQNIKYDLLTLGSEGLAVRPVSFDTMIASYLLNPAKKHGLSALALEYLGETMIEYKEVCGTGAKQIPFTQVPLDRAVEYAGEDADITFRLTKILGGMIEKEGLAELMEKVELPLLETLARMERTGVFIDAGALETLGGRIGSRMADIEGQVYEAAGEEFNINSPKQLGRILFEKLKLPGGRKTKTGFSTDQATLENLALEHALPAMVVEYRQLAKLKSGYVDALPKMINPATGRIHTSFNQTVAATGRLSSSDPNLQNIPIRTELGREIRRAFVAPEGRALVSADYSQIELRLLAHFAQEKTLLEAFGAGEDIHARTAAEIFGVNPGFVTPDMRRVAKSVNFGIIYGQTAFGLANELKIPRNEAQRYIDNYFKRYPGIKKYIAESVAEAKKNGYVSTLLGRRRYLPDIAASNRQARQFAERNAVNSPLQGSAADIIKLAMISIDGRLADEGYESKMILQVHDELVFEAPEDETDRLCKMVREEMEGVVELSTPLLVDVKTGADWDEAH